MRVLPRSLSGRLLITAVLAIAVALVLATFAIGHVLERFVMHGLDERLDAQIAIVERAVAADGTLDAAKAIDLPPYDRPGSGWAWEVIGPSSRLRSGSLQHAALSLPREGGPLGLHDPNDRRRHGGPRPLEGTDASGRVIHYRVAVLPTRRGDVVVLAGGPRAIVDRPLREAMVPLLLSVLLLGGFLVLALVVQLRFGLRPLTALRMRVADVRAGRARHVEVEEPTELLPLVGELNALIDANEDALAHARGHVANLAHGLKTPLATLKLDLAQRGGAGALTAQVERMESQIRHHLGRARAAEAGGRTTPCLLAPRIADLAGALARIHADRPIREVIAVDPGVAVDCDPQDLDEMLGNLLDNAWHHARTTVRVDASIDGRAVEIRIDDDGPGMTVARLAELNTRQRLDEQAGGHGFGIAIARELAELHGGTLVLSAGALGGVAAILRLRSPAPR